MIIPVAKLFRHFIPNADLAFISALYMKMKKGEKKLRLRRDNSSGLRLKALFPLLTAVILGHLAPVWYGGIHSGFPIQIYLHPEN